MGLPIIGALVAGAADGQGIGLCNHQGAVVRLDDNVFVGGVHRAFGALCEGGGIGVCVSAGGAYGDGGEAGLGCGYGVGVLNLSGNIEAADGMGLAVVGYGIGVGGEDYVLIVLNGDDRIRGGVYGNGGYRGRVACNGSGIFGNRAADGGVGYGLGCSDFHSVPDIAHGVVGHIQLELGGEGGIGIHTVGGSVQVLLYCGQIQRRGTGYPGVALVPAHELVIGGRVGSAAQEAGIHGLADGSQGVGGSGHAAVGFGLIGDGNGLHRPHGIHIIFCFVQTDRLIKGKVGNSGILRLCPAHQCISGTGEGTLAQHGM